MIYKLEPSRVTKQMLIDLKSEEEYMSFYLGIIPGKGMFRNPLRNDKRPTCGFYRAREKNNELIFKDFGSGFYGNFVDVVMEKFKCGYRHALDIIGNDFGVVTKPGVKNECQAKYDGSKVEGDGYAKLQCEVQPFTTIEARWWNSFGISTDTLRKYNVVSVKNLFLNDNYILSSGPRNPVYGYYFGKEDGRELWKIYFPMKTQYRFMSNTNKLQGVKQLPATGEYVVVTKSLKDVMVLHELGIPAVAPQGESVIISKRQYETLSKRFKHVIVNGDWDRAGQHFMFESRKRYGCICLAFTDKECDGKDISDYVKKHGMEKAKEIISNLKEQISKGLHNYHLQYSKVNEETVPLPDDKETGTVHFGPYSELKELPDTEYEDSTLFSK